MTEQLWTQAMFLPYLHQDFFIDLSDGHRVTLELVQVQDLGTQNTLPGREAFSLLFVDHENRDQYLPQRVYPLKHETLGEHELFIVPLGPDKDGMRYQIIFT